MNQDTLPVYPSRTEVMRQMELDKAILLPEIFLKINRNSDDEVTENLQSINLFKQLRGLEFL